jgi:hypothetical protein
MKTYINLNKIIIKQLKNKKLGVKFEGLDLEIDKTEELDFIADNLKYTPPTKNTARDQAIDINNTEMHLSDKSTPGFFIFKTEDKKIKVQLNVAQGFICV